MGLNSGKLRLGRGILLLFVAGIIGMGCNSSPNGGGGNGKDYTLTVVLEKNLDLDRDIIYLKFEKNDLGIPGAIVVIDGDTLATSSASGLANKTYTTPRWLHGEKIQIVAVDTGGSFVYRDSVVIPDAFQIDNVLPANRIWRPIDGNAQVSWTTSFNAVNYVVSVQARSTSSISVGFSGYYEAQASLTQVIPPETFKDQFGNLVEDVYDLEVIAYSPNFAFRPNPPYKKPTAEDIRTPILKSNITGGISALVVCPRDTLLVQTQ